MGAWYTIGLFAGLGVAIGVLLAAALGVSRVGLPLALLLGAVGGAVLAWVVAGWPEGVGGGLGGALGAAGASEVVRGTLGRGGTRGGTAALVGLGALVLAALSFIPLLGYVEAVAVPALGARLRRRGGDTYAGLRILARD